MYYFVNELHSISNDMNVNKNFSDVELFNFFSKYNADYLSCSAPSLGFRH